VSQYLLELDSLSAGLRKSCHKKAKRRLGQLFNIVDNFGRKAKNNYNIHEILVYQQALCGG
jgi:hypothetical protein